MFVKCPEPSRNHPWILPTSKRARKMMQNASIHSFIGSVFRSLRRVLRTLPPAEYDGGATSGAKHSSWAAKIQKSNVYHATLQHRPLQLMSSRFLSTSRKTDKKVFKKYLEESTVLVSASGDHEKVLSKSGFCFSRWDFLTIFDIFFKMSRIIQESSLEPPAIEKSTKNDAEC